MLLKSFLLLTSISIDTFHKYHFFYYVPLRKATMNMNMDPNGMSPWFTTQDGTYPPVNAQTQLPNNGGAGSDFTAPIPGSSGLGGTVGSSSGFYDDGDDENEFAHEPPLLEGFSDIFLFYVSI